MIPYRWLVSVLLTVALALPEAATASDEFLEPTQAFKLALGQKSPSGPLLIQFEVVQGHYMYGESFRMQTADGEPVPLQVPPGVRKFDETFQKEVETHRGRVQLLAELPAAQRVFLLTGQGCADRGLCYPPMQVRLAELDGQWTFTPVDDPSLNFGRTDFLDQSIEQAAKPPTRLRLDILLAVMAGMLTLFGIWAATQRTSK